LLRPFRMILMRPRPVLNESSPEKKSTQSETKRKNIGMNRDWSIGRQARKRDVEDIFLDVRPSKITIPEPSEPMIISQRYGLQHFLGLRPVCFFSVLWNQSQNDRLPANIDPFGKGNVDAIFPGIRRSAKL
jgi:hypothetical protein